MSIEQELKEAYKQSATKLKRPAELDTRIEQLYRKQMFRKQTKRHAIKKSWTFRIIVAGLLLTSMGFSTQYVIQFKDEIIDYIIHNDEMEDYDAELAKQMRSSLEQMKQSLPIDGKGLFYSKDLKKLLPKTKRTAYSIVSNPYVWKVEKEWDAELNEAHAQLQLPESLSETLTFVGGQKEMPFGGVLPIDGMTFVNELDQRVKKEKPEEVWIPLSDRLNEDTAHPVFTTTYENQDSDVIQITMELFSEESNIHMRSSVAEHDQIQIGEQSATYTLSKPFLFSNSDQYQSVFWLESLEEETILYTIGSPESDISMTELTSIAEQFMH